MSDASPGHHTGSPGSTHTYFLGENMATRRSTGRSVLLWIGAGLWVILPFGLIAAIVLWSGQIRFTEAAETWTPVETGQAQTDSPMELALGWEQGPVLRAPAWTGLITAVQPPRTTVAHGDVVVTIDGIDRIAAHTPAPFWRPIGPDTIAGADIGALNTLLGDLGLARGTANTFGSGTARGITQLAKKLGAEGDTFDPAWVLHLAEPRITVGAAAFSVGQTAPAAGEELFAPRPRVTAALVTGEGMAPENEGPLGGGGNGGARAALPVFDAERIMRMPVPAEAILRVGGTEIPLEETRDSVTAEGLAALTETVGAGEAKVRALISQTTQTQGWQVPAAAVYGVGAASCVLTKDGPVRVEVSAGEGGSVVVSGELSTASRVLLQVPAERRACP
ncbi:hypothetical protein D9V32_11660 [Mycetocola tolaasinivorans]|uniref:Uncharacterized protein n=1 Tax=Mycetocola tolaasinivorans TaxID=76635 RepID=A0A3L7A446_9MICO|nr:hypothetical protein [Mycetocola tolaasinivorans]RLP75069.1 hypothetical protein D9V32_11660 [Mycetocola tolaasinivorans]